RSAWMLRRASTVAPTGARPAKPPAIPADTTVRYGVPAASARASSRAVPAAAATGPTPVTATVTGDGDGRPASTARRSGSTAVTTSTGRVMSRPRAPAGGRGSGP